MRGLRKFLGYLATLATFTYLAYIKANDTVFIYLIIVWSFFIGGNMAVKLFYTRGKK